MRHGLFKAAAAVAGQDRSKAFLLEHHADGVAQAFVVVDHENRLHSIHSDCSESDK